jgi:hypothetical protein
MQNQPTIDGLTEEVVKRATPHTFAHFYSGGRFRMYRHVRYIGRRIAAAVAARGARLIVNMPPGHGKSSLISHWTPVWFLDNAPEKRVIVTSHGAELAAHWGRSVRNELETNPRLSVKLREDSKAANRWNTPEGGGMVTSGVGGGITGFRGNLILVDDPHPTWEAAHSPTQRRQVAEWFTGTLNDRGEPGASVIVLMHRWHEEDLAGFLLSQHPERWQVIRLPALAEPGDMLGREVGEALCPERYTVDDLTAAHAEVGDLVWDAKYQQNPQGVGSGRAYANYIPAVHEDKGVGLRKDLPLQLSFDFNVNPGVHCIVGQYDQRADLFTAVHEVYGPRQKTRGTMHALKKLIQSLGGWQWPEIQVFGDRNGNSEHTTTDSTDYHIIGEELAGCGRPVRMRVQTKNPPIKRRMISFNEALRDGRGDVHYRVNPLTCPRLCRDLRNVKEDEDGLIDKSNPDLTHPSDAEGYRITYLRPAVQESTIVGTPAAVPQPA